MQLAFFENFQDFPMKLVVGFKIWKKKIYSIYSQSNLKIFKQKKRTILIPDTDN